MIVGIVICILFAVGIITNIAMLAALFGNEEIAKVLQDEHLYVSWACLFGAGLLSVLDEKLGGGR